MITLTTGQIEAWIALYLWPFVRIGGCLMTAPVFSAATVPMRGRLILAVAITLIVAPLLPVQNAQVFSASGFVILAQQLLIGVAFGFAVNLVFDALALGGQLLANSMGLSFAFNVDPLHGASTPVLSQFYTILATLTFLALDGHLALLQVLIESFQTMPVGRTGLGSEGLWQMCLWGSQIFRGGLMVSLPGVTALLVVNLAFGVVSRAAPSLNLFAIGFPVTLVCGLLILLQSIPSMQQGFISMLHDALVLLGNLKPTVR
jgi:flagellar biosynthetic protein FliR